MNIDSSLINSEVYVNNAGIVLLYPYISMLFERLELTNNNTFRSNEYQLKAVHYLQFLITGRSQTEESLLLINKIICGLGPTTLVPDRIEITKDEEELMNGLLTAAIAQWSALGSTSIEGYRDSFLKRDGILKENINSWKLFVEQKAFDMLLDQLPYSYTPIKLPWMDKMVQVVWR